MVAETNISVLTKIFKKFIVLDESIALTDNKIDVAADITAKYITTPWFNDLFLVFMYLEKDNAQQNTKFSACPTVTDPTDVDKRRTLYYAKYMNIGSIEKMELLSFKGFTTEHFVKVRELVEKVRAAAAAGDVDAIIKFLNTDNDVEFKDILTDVALFKIPENYNAPNEIFGGKKNKSSKQRKYRKNKSSRKH